MLDFLPRLVSFRARPDGTTTTQSTAWLHFLQQVYIHEKFYAITKILQIPGVSEAKAQKLMDHFPTINSLMDAYNNPNLTEMGKEQLVADKMGSKRERKISKYIYRALNSDNPNEIIS